MVLEILKSEYETFDSGNLIGFKVDVDDVVSNN